MVPIMASHHAALTSTLSLMTAAGMIFTSAPAAAAPGPEVEYTYNVIVRRHFEFPNNDAIGYGHRICGKVAAGMPYVNVLDDVKHDVLPNDEGSAVYVVSYAVNLLCPVEIPRLRNSAANYGQAAR